jgi:hypothetical protein
MYSNFQICELLKSKEKCFRVRIYNDGKFEDVFHQHIPAYRISEENALEALKSLNIFYSGSSAVTILHSRLNKRGKNPNVAHTFNIVTEYPEAGVIRRYCSSQLVTVWFDEVIMADKFRSTN